MTSYFSNLTVILRLGGISLVHCNRNGNENEPIELKVQINKNVTKTPPSGNFVDYGDTWVGTFPAETLSRKVVKDYLIMSQTVQLRNRFWNNFLQWHRFLANSCQKKSQIENVSSGKDFRSIYAKKNRTFS